MFASSKGAPSFAITAWNALETLRISVPTVLEAAMGRVTQDVCDARLAAWGRRLCAHAGADVEVSGLEHARGVGPFLIMTNHQSYYDIPVVFSVFGGHLRMVAKKELFRIPIFGQAMKAARFIFIDRRDRYGAIESLALARKTLDDGLHVWIAPEGTRSVDGRIGPFKRGAFYLALEANVSVLPVTLEGTRNLLPVSGVRTRPGARITVTVHPPIPIADYQHLPNKEGRARLAEDVRRAIERTAT